MIQFVQCDTGLFQEGNSGGDEAPLGEMRNSEGNSYSESRGDGWQGQPSDTEGWLDGPQG